MPTKRPPLALVQETQGITLSTLGADTAIKAGSQVALTEDFFDTSVDVLISAHGLTAGEGPVYIGIADNNYTVAEIAEFILIDGPTGRGDKTSLERIGRNVRIVAQVTNENPIPANGEAIRRKIVSLFKEGQGWSWFAFNRDTSALTTGGVIKINATHFGQWRGG